MRKMKRFAPGLACGFALALAGCTGTSGSVYTVGFPGDFPLTVTAPIDGNANTWYDVSGLAPGTPYALNISIQKTTTAASAGAYSDLMGDTGSGVLCTVTIPSGSTSATCMFSAQSNFVFLGVQGYQDGLTLNLSSQ